MPHRYQQRQIGPRDVNHRYSHDERGSIEERAYVFIVRNFFLTGHKKVQLVLQVFCSGRMIVSRITKRVCSTTYLGGGKVGNFGIELSNFFERYVINLSKT